MTACAMRALRSGGTWLSTMDDGRTRALVRKRQSRPISTICRSRWQHDDATSAVALLRSGYALSARGHDAGKTCLSTGSDATYRDRNAVARNRATSDRRLGSAGRPSIIDPYQVSDSCSETRVRDHSDDFAQGSVLSAPEVVGYGRSLTIHDPLRSEWSGTIFQFEV